MVDVQLLGHWRAYRRRKREDRFLAKLPQLRCRVCGVDAVAGVHSEHERRLAPVCERHAAEASRFGLHVVWSDERAKR